jgi:hypothetical protein
MRRLILCLERLQRIQRVLNRARGAMPVRDITRSFAIWPWEIRQAAELGWLRIVTRRPVIATIFRLLGQEKEA